MTRSKRLLGLLAFLLSINVAAADSQTKPGPDGLSRTGFFAYDEKAQKIIAPLPDAPASLRLKFISLSTDQPTYWPDEQVFLKVMMPSYPSATISARIQKPHSLLKSIGTFTLDAGGVFVAQILDGKKSRLELGNYRVDFSGPDGRTLESTTFNVIEGTLGALSFAHEFTRLTSMEALREFPGGWFLGNASGMGSRWGNGLNIKNEIRVLNKPYSGEVTVKSRCYLPGCDGCLAGEPVKARIRDGRIEAVLEVRSHSGPFEIEAVTPEGSVRSLFAQSGHVERQSSLISKGLTRVFRATAAPYEGTTPILGRDLYYTLDHTESGDAWEIDSPIADSRNEIRVKASFDLKNARVFLYSALEASESFSMTEIASFPEMRKGQEMVIGCPPPFGFVLFGGFEAATGELFEGWTLAFCQSPIEVKIKAADKALPQRPVEISIAAVDRNTGSGIPVSGILEVFDNRVPSKSAKESLVSAVGDSVRKMSYSLAGRMRREGKRLEEVKWEKSVSPRGPVAPPPPPPPKPLSRAKGAPPPAFSPLPAVKTGSKGNATGEDLSGDSAPPPRSDEIRLDEKKVVFCAAVTTDSGGNAVIVATLPPQLGRCQIRFTACRMFDYAETIRNVDMVKGSYVEATVPGILVPKASIVVKAHVRNVDGKSLRLEVSGAGMEKDLSFEIGNGSKEIAFPVTGGRYGRLKLDLKDSTGNMVDLREFEVRNVADLATHFSDVILTDGSPVTIEKGKKGAVLAHPGMLLTGMVADVVTTLHSWFATGESLSAAIAVRAVLLRAISEGLIGDEGLLEELGAGLRIDMKALRGSYIDPQTGMVRPFPGGAPDPLWTAWSARHLRTAVVQLSESKKLQAEFSSEIHLGSKALEAMEKALASQGISITETAFSEQGMGGRDVLPIVVDGRIVHLLLSDASVVKWFRENAGKNLVDGWDGSWSEYSVRFQKSYDTYRFLRAFEHVGGIYYLLLNAKAMYLSGDKAFIPLFNKIARGLILTREPGLIKGPALLGGVYSSPHALVKFLELLIMMAGDGKIEKNPVVQISPRVAGSGKSIMGNAPQTFDSGDDGVLVETCPFAAVKVEDSGVVNLYEYLDRKQFFGITMEKIPTKVGDEGLMRIDLEKGCDPAEFYAIIAVPSVLGILQTEDLLSDYKGQLIYGQKSAGGGKVQLITVPFRGSPTMSIKIEGIRAGESEGFVLVRHMNDISRIATVKIPACRVE